MASFARPENALKRADDLIAVGQKDQALQTLHDVITSKRHRTWAKVLEDIMKKYVQLCVELRKGKFAKEGLHQYKIICQVNYNSLEIVIKHYLQIAEASAKDAQSKAKQTILDIEDLEAEESAESIILTAVSGEDRTDRTDREIVTPWLRFLWETYRTVLETLRNSAKLEALYHETAQQAFNFCLQYQRKNEFRRLSDILRNHLTNLGKYPNQPQSINLNNPETLQVHLDTRFTQLNVATELELWQEAFRSVEDIHGLMTMAHKPLTAKMMETYFHRLARIFWVSDNYLFHALKEKQTDETKARLTSLASSVLLAALSIPLPDPKLADEQYFEYDLQKVKNLRMGTLLGFTITPKRDYLIQDLVSKKVTQMVFPELQDIYAILEKRFNPLQLCQKMAEKFAFIKSKPELAQYEEQLQKLTFLRLIQQLSQVYESMKIADFKKMVSFMDSHTIEKLLVSTVKRRFAGVRIDHQNGAIHFGGSGHESDQLRDQLTQLAKGLQQASKLIHPKPQNEETYIKGKKEAFVKIIDGLKDMFVYFQNRRDIIEMRKRLAEKKAEEDKLHKQKQDKEKIKKMENELKRQEEKKRIKNAKKELDAKNKAQDLQERLNQLRPYISDNVDARTIDDPQKYIEKKLKEEKQAKKKTEEKLHDLANELTHKERAQREVEKLLLVKQLEQKKVDDRHHWEELVNKSEVSLRAQHATELEEKKRLARMAGARAVFEDRLMTVRKTEYERRKADQDRRLAEIMAQREEERQRIAKEEEEKRNRIEEEKRVLEEREREKKRIEEEKKAEEEARKKKLADQAELQRKREAEALSRAKEAEDKLKEEQRRKDEEEREKKLAERKEPNSWRRPGANDTETRNAPPAAAPATEGRWRREDAEGPTPAATPARDEWRRDPRDDRPRDPRDDRSRDDQQRWRRDDPRDDRAREEQPRFDRPKESLGKDDDRWRREDSQRPRDENRWRRDEAVRAPDDRWRRDDRPRDDRPRDDKPRDDRPRDDRPRYDRPRDDRPRDDRPRDDRPRDDRPPREDSWRRDDRPRDDRPRDDRPRDDKPREDTWRRDDRSSARDDSQKGSWRDNKPQQNQETEAKGNDNKSRDADRAIPAKNEPQREDTEKGKPGDGFSVVASKRRGGGKK